MPNIEQGTPILSHVNQNNVLLKIQATNHTLKYIQTSSEDQVPVHDNNILFPISHSAMPSMCSKANDVSTASLSVDHPIKHSHTMGSIEEYSIKECKLVISNSLAAHIRSKRLWEENSNMVSIGSPSKEILDFSGNVFAGTEYDDISIDNVFFTESGIRYSFSFYRNGYNTYTHSVSNHWILTLNCSSVEYMLNIIPSAYLNLCAHGLTYSTCKDYKGKSCQEGNITPFWILDSRASLYFTGDCRDFTTFEILHMPIPIHTANGSIFITGKGSIVLKYLSIDTKEVTTILELVFSYEDLTC